MKSATGRAESKPRPNKTTTVHRRQQARRRTRLRRLAIAGLTIALGGLIVYSLARPKAPEGPAPTAFTGADFHSLVVDPEDPKRLFAGGHQAVSVSTDGGRTWQVVPSLADADAMGWAFLDDEILISGHPGISVSNDGGGSFRRDNRGLPSSDIHALGGTGEIIYAASPQVGLFVSTDERRSWQIRNDQVGGSFMGRILVDPADPDHLLASDVSSGVAESRDGGRSWDQLAGVQPAIWLSWDPAAPLRLIASGPGEAEVTIDGGTSWEPLRLPPGVQMVEMVPGEPNLLYAGSHDGSSVTLYVSNDGGDSWSPTDTTRSGR